MWGDLWLKTQWVKEFAPPVCMYKIEYEKKWGKKEKRFEYIFLAQIKSWEIIKTQIEEIDDFKYFTVDEIQDLEETYAQVKEIAKKISK